MQELNTGDIVIFKERPGHYNGRFRINAIIEKHNDKYVTLSPLDNPAKHWTKVEVRGTGHELELHMTMSTFTYNHEHLKIIKTSLEAKEL